VTVVISELHHYMTTCIAVVQCDHYNTASSIDVLHVMSDSMVSTVLIGHIMGH